MVCYIVGYYITGFCTMASYTLGSYTVGSYTLGSNSVGFDTTGSYPLGFYTMGFCILGYFLSRVSFFVQSPFCKEWFGFLNKFFVSSPSLACETTPALMFPALRFVWVDRWGFPWFASLLYSMRYSKCSLTPPSTSTS